MSTPMSAVVIGFLSAGSGAGQTSTLTNLAWLLADAGKRVLIVDWATELPNAAQYMRPLLLDHLAPDEALGPDPLAVLTTASDAIGLALDSTVERHSTPETAGLVDTIGAAAQAAPVLSPRTGEPHETMRGLHYDYVLIDGPDISVRLIRDLCDVVVLCFRLLQPGAIADAAALGGELLKDVSRRIDLVPVAAMLDEQYMGRAERALGIIRAAFADLLPRESEPLLPRGVVEIPFRAYEPLKPVLTVLAEQQEADSRLIGAYNELAAVVTRGEVAQVRPIPAAVRTRYRRGLGLEPDIEPPTVVVAHTARTRPWADWARGQLELAGARVRRWHDELGLADATHALLIGDQDEADRFAAAFRELSADVRLTRLHVTTKSSDEDEAALVLEGVTEQQARVRLLSHFGLLDPGGVPPIGLARFPSAHPALFDVPPANPDFVGRDAEIERLRETLVSGVAGRVQVIGTAGIGKSELALEYAHRFAHDYDLVWWASAHDRHSVAEAHSSLIRKLRRNTTGWSVDLPEELAADPANRWLIVYDNADDEQVFSLFLAATGAGHVLVTTTSEMPGVTAIRLGELHEDESSSLLAGQVPQLTAPDAHGIAETVKHLPLALDLAAAWLKQTVLDAARSSHAAAAEFIHRMEAEGAGPGGTEADVLGVVIGTLRENALGRATVLLAELCSFLSPQGVDIRMLRATAVWRRFIDAIGVDAWHFADDADELDRVLWTGARFALFDVDWGRSPTLRMHRVIQTSLRDRMTGEDHDERQRQVLSALAEFAPSDVDNDLASGVRRYGELRRHVPHSGALTSDLEHVRRWMVSQTRFSYIDGGPSRWATALDQAELLMGRWQNVFGEDDPLLQRLTSQAANLYRAMGNNVKALELDDRALVHQRRSLHQSHPHALVTARGRGGDLRGIGAFEEALAEDQSTWAGLRKVLGDDHPHTRSAANNLALSMSLSGDSAGALRLEQDNYKRRLRLFGPEDEQTWRSLCVIGTYLRELGRYEESIDVLRTAREHARLLRPAPNPLEMRIRWDYAISERLSGRPRAARDRNVHTLLDHQSQYGRSHPWTLGCMLSLAIDHRLLGENDIAIELTEECLRRFREDVGLGEHHPFLALCQMALAIGLSERGEHERAEEKSNRGRHELQSYLGSSHPWTLAANANHALVLRPNREDEAVSLLLTVHADCIDYLGTSHPYTVLLRHNITRGSWRPIDIDLPQT